MTMQCLSLQLPFRRSARQTIKAAPTRIVLFDRNDFSRGLSTTPIRQATHGAQGRANGPKNGAGKRLGAKKTGDEYVIPGNIIFRQRGTHWFPGENVGMGRDHTIFALQSGYVKYYRNPSLNPKRQYIGIVFDKDQTLPTPQNAARRRRLGLIAVPRQDVTLPRQGESLNVGDIGIFSENQDLPAPHGAAAGITTGQDLSKRAMKEAKRRQATGRVPGNELQMRPDYSYRESNWQIGRAAERAGVQVQRFKKGDRFLAWRLRSARIKRNAERRTVGGKKGKKEKSTRGGGGGGRRPQ